MSKQRCQTCKHHRYLGNAKNCNDNGSHVFVPINGFACLQGDEQVLTLWQTYPKNCTRYEKYCIAREEFIKEQIDVSLNGVEQFVSCECWNTECESKDYCSDFKQRV